MTVPRKHSLIARQVIGQVTFPRKSGAQRRSTLAKLVLHHSRPFETPANRGRKRTGILGGYNHRGGVSGGNRGNGAGIGSHKSGDGVGGFQKCQAEPFFKTGLNVNVCRLKGRKLVCLFNDAEESNVIAQAEPLNCFM